jgi:CO/xanthine dehydrogenase Mo-binding subunit
MGYGPVIPDEAHARLVLLDDGRFRLFSGVVDMGQGNASTFLQIAAQVLEQPYASFELLQPDTAETKSSGSSSASRTTYTFGNAILGAAQILRQRILDQAAKLINLKVGLEKLAMIPGAVRHAESAEEISLAEIAAALHPEQCDVTHYFRSPVAEKPQAPDQAIAMHGFPHAVYSYAAHLAAVEVDELTGQTELLDYLTVSDCGRVLNPQLLSQQMDGAVVQGMGYALCEDFIAQKGQSLTLDFSTYIIPSALDAPRIENIFLKSHDSSSPLGMRGAGEIGVNGPLPAVGNAIARACGAALTRFPLTPERVLEALDRGDIGK